MADISSLWEMGVFCFFRMIEFLNFNAKVKFMKAGFINGVELCDLYVSIHRFILWNRFALFCLYLFPGIPFALLVYRPRVVIFGILHQQWNGSCRSSSSTFKLWLEGNTNDARIGTPRGYKVLHLPSYFWMCFILFLTSIAWNHFPQCVKFFSKSQLMCFYL